MPDDKHSIAVAIAAALIVLVLVLIATSGSEEPSAPPLGASLSAVQRLNQVQACLDAGTRSRVTNACVRAAMVGYVPPVVPSVTATLPPTTPPATTAPVPTTSPPSTTTPAATTTTVAPISCQGQQIAAGTGLGILNDGSAKTYCLAPGTYLVPSNITVDNGDIIQGAGVGETFIKGTGATNMFSADSGATWEFRDLDISGAVGNAGCAPDCGRAFIGTGEQLTLIRIRCHDNANQCVGSGSADLYFIGNECDHNGNTLFASLTAVRSTACIKRIRGGTTGIRTEVRDSFIHDNYWGGVWFDFYEGQALIENNTITDNGKMGIGWEVSGGFNSADSLVVRNNVIQDNGLANVHPVSGGILCNTCADFLAENNTFGGNSSQGAVRFISSTREWGNIHGVTVRNNDLNGDNLNCPSGASCTGNS